MNRNFIDESQDKFNRQFDASPERHALILAEKGRAVVPMHAPSKRPIHKNWQNLASKDPETLRDWFTNPLLVPAVLCGEPSGVMALDVEAKNGGLDWLEAARNRLPETEEYSTRSGGRHLVFRYRPGQRTIPLGKIHAGVELRAAGALAIYWPAAGLPLLSAAPPADLPTWVLPAVPSSPAPLRGALAPWTPPPGIGADKARNYAAAALHNAVRRVAGTTTGSRNSTLNAETYGLARFIASGTLSPREIAEAMAHAGLSAGLDATEVQATIASALGSAVR